MCFSDLVAKKSLIMTESDYSIITETPGQKADKEQLERALQRYKFAKKYSEGKDILEIACGSGIGLKYLAGNAKSVIGIDIDEANLAIAKKNTDGHNLDSSISVQMMDAHDLKFENNQFDVIFLFEAIYYLKEPKKFISEAQRILKQDGTLIIGSVNKDWESFHPSPLTHQYFSIPDYQSLLKNDFNHLEFYGGFYTNKDSRFFSFLKNLATRFNLIPGSLKTRAFLKRIFMGKLIELPESIHDKMAKYFEPEQIKEIKANKDYKIIYVVARK